MTSKFVPLFENVFNISYRSGEIVSSYSVQDESGEAAAILLNPTNNKMQKLSDSDNKRLLNVGIFICKFLFISLKQNKTKNVYNIA